MSFHLTEQPWRIGPQQMSWTTAKIFVSAVNLEARSRQAAAVGCGSAKDEPRLLLPDVPFVLLSSLNTLICISSYNSQPKWTSSPKHQGCEMDVDPSIPCRWFDLGLNRAGGVNLGYQRG
jgi:hypothetical protein